MQMQRMAKTGMEKISDPQAVSVEAIEQLGKGRCRVKFDNGEQWILYRKEVHTIGLAEGSGLTGLQYQTIRQDVIGRRAKKRALHLLEKMDRTESGLRQKLLEGEYPEDLVEEAIAYVKQYHYIDDERYADTYIRLRGEGKSRAKLLLELQQKGIGRELALRALEQSDGERNECAMIQALLLKRHYDSECATLEEKRRMYGYLMRRGFQSADICRVLGHEQSDG